MADERWNVPQTEPGLQTLLARLEESRAAGDEAAVGHGLLALAWLVKQVRSDNDEPPFVRAGTLAAEAIEVFRRVGDEQGLLAALRAPSVFLGPEETDRHLDEAMAIAERLGNRREIARTLAAKGRALGLRDREGSARFIHQALAEFRALDDRTGQAACLLSLSIQLGKEDEKYRAACDAAILYRETGNLGMAAKCASIAVGNGKSFLTFPEMEPLIRQGLADAIAAVGASVEAIFYGYLAKVAVAKGNEEEASECLRRQKSLQESDGLTPQERRRNDVEMTKTLIAMSRAAGNEEGVALFEAELRRLRRRKRKGEA